MNAIRSPSRNHACALTTAVLATLLVTANPALAQGITLVAPVDGAVVRPGATVDVQFVVDPALGIEVILLAERSGGIGSDAALVLEGPPFRTSVVVKPDFAGKLDFFVGGASADYQAQFEGPLFALNVIPENNPVNLQVSGSVYLDLSSGVRTKSLAPVGIYADGTRRSLDEPGLGVTYNISDPTVATVDESGAVTALAVGYAYVTTRAGSAKAYTAVEVRDSSSNPTMPIQDVTEHFDIQRSGFRFDPARHRFAQEVTIRNISEVPVPGAQLVVTDLPSGVELTNGNFRTRTVEPLGSPGAFLQPDYTKHPPYIEPGESAQAVLEFRNREGAPIDYTLRVFVGDGL